MWKPNTLILKGDQRQRKEVVGFYVPPWAGMVAVWGLCRAPSLLAPQPGGTLGISLGLLGSEGLGCRS